MLKIMIVGTIVVPARLSMMTSSGGSFTQQDVLNNHCPATFAPDKVESIVNVRWLDFIRQSPVTS
jgi:hypothetical protein